MPKLEPVEIKATEMEWADLYGNQLEDVLRLDPEDDAETLAIINDALLAAGDAFHVLP